jgi:hypothetical protein
MLSSFQKLLDLNREVCNAIEKHTLANLQQLSCETVSQHIHTQIVSNLIKGKRERNETERRSGSELLKEDEDKTKVMLKENGLTQIYIQIYIHLYLLSV